jgi:hypothetical protein
MSEDNVAGQVYVDTFVDGLKRTVFVVVGAFVHVGSEFRGSAMRGKIVVGH